jgi:hypothetical protein
VNAAALARAAVAAAVLWYVFGGGAGLQPGPASGPYAGPMAGLHSAAAAMQQQDRAVLAEALAAAGEMLAADVQGLVSTTEELQRYVKAVTEFDYLGLGKPTAKYPAVASAIQTELARAIGPDVAPVTPAMRSAVAAALTEAGKAVR